MSTVHRRLALLAVSIVLVAAGSAKSQIPDKFTNLKVLPKDISKRELVSTMRSFSMALGERCSYCHVDDDATGKTDFASDDKDHKETARTMMKMVGDINGVYLAKLEDKDRVKVRCITCHHGVALPRTIDNIVLDTAQKDGLDAALAKYRELRDKYYGSAAYDFSAVPLNEAAETMAQERNDVAGAITLAKFNLEFNPDNARTYLLLGQLYQASGDKAAAIANVEKSLELDPDNRWAKGILEKLKATE